MELEACPEHVELAIDRIVDEEERAPEVSVVTRKPGEREVGGACFRCGAKPKYIVR